MEGQHLSKQRWLELVEAQRTSGLTVDPFCQQHGLAVSTFYGWKRRLKDDGLLSVEAASGNRSEAKASPRKSVNPGEAPAFVEVTASATDDRQATPLELVLPGEVVVRVPRGFDPDTLRRVGEALS